MLTLCVSLLFQNPPNITSFMTQDILFYNISITGSSSPEVKVTAGREVCTSNGMCNHTIRDDRLTEPRYNVKVAASNIIGIGQPVTCQGQIGKQVQRITHRICLDVSTENVYNTHCFLPTACKGLVAQLVAHHTKVAKVWIRILYSCSL